MRDFIIELNYKITIKVKNKNDYKNFLIENSVFDKDPDMSHIFVYTIFSEDCIDLTAVFDNYDLADLNITTDDQLKIFIKNIKRKLKPIIRQYLHKIFNRYNLSIKIKSIKLTDIEYY